MIRTLMFASAVALSAPAIAQDTPQQTPQAPATESTTTAPPAESQTPAPAQTTPQTTPAPAETAPQTTPAPAPADQAAAQPNSSTSVAQVVDTDFPAYDTDKNGELSKEEFAAWMTKLRAAQPGADTTAQTDSKAWTDAAFAQADADKNQSVSKGELTSFLQG